MPTIAEVRAKFPQYSDMSDGDLAGALHKKYYADIPREEFNKKIGFAETPAPEFSATKGFSDVPGEMARTAQGHIDTVKKGLFQNPQESAVGGFLDTGKALASIPAGVFDTLIGAPARAIGAPVMAKAQHLLGGLVNPEAAAKDDPKQMEDYYKGAIDTSLMAATPRGASPAGVRMKPAPAPTAAELKAAAKGVYQDPAIKSIPIPVADAQALQSRIESGLLSEGFRPTTGSAPGTLSEVGNMKPPTGATSVGVDDLRAARRALNMTAKQRDPLNKATPDAVAAQKAIAELDTFLDTISPSLREANANYAAGKRADTLDFRSMRAEDRAAKTGSGSNIENTMRQEVDKIGDRGLSDLERALRDRITKGSVTRNALRKVGKLGVSDGLSLLLHAGAGVGSGGATLPIAAAGTVARKIGEMLTRSEIKALNKSIRNRSPLAASRPPVPLSKVNPIVAALMAPQAQPGFQFLPRAVLPAGAEQDK